VKVLVTGSRDWLDRGAIEEGFDITSPSLVIHGDARGADSIAHAVAMTRGIDVARFPANWEGRGKAAGPYRNRLMFDLLQPDIVLAFPLPHSRGTIDMIEYAESKGCTIITKGKDF
jgi:hypothetical protein